MSATVRSSRKTSACWARSQDGLDDGLYLPSSCFDAGMGCCGTQEALSSSVLDLQLHRAFEEVRERLP